MHEIVVRQDHHFLRGLLVTGGLVYTATEAIFFFRQFLTTNYNTATFCLLLMLWLIPIVVFSIGVLWICFGVRVISIRGGELTVTQRIGRTKFGKLKSFAVDDIRNLRVEERKRGIKGKSVASYTLTFDYRDTRQDLLEHLSAKRAESLLAGPLHRFQT